MEPHGDDAARCLGLHEDSSSCHSENENPKSTGETRKISPLRIVKSSVFIMSLLNSQLVAISLLGVSMASCV